MQILTIKNQKVIVKRLFQNFDHQKFPVSSMKAEIIYSDEKEWRVFSIAEEWIWEDLSLEICFLFKLNLVLHETSTLMRHMLMKIKFYLKTQNICSLKTIRPKIPITSDQIQWRNCVDREGFVCELNSSSEANYGSPIFHMNIKIIRSQSMGLKICKLEWLLRISLRVSQFFGKESLLSNSNLNQFGPSNCFLEQKVLHGHRKWEQPKCWWQQNLLIWTETW